MNRDIRSEILKQLDVNDLSLLCLTDQNFYSICVNKDFWYNYFKYNQLIMPIEATTLKEWIKLFKYVKEIDIQTNRVLNGLAGPPKVVGFENTFQSKTLYITELDKVKINDPTNYVILDFFNSLIGDSKPSFRIVIAYYKDHYVLELEGSNFDASLPFTEMVNLYNKNYKDMAYKINRDIAYQYIFAILYYKLQGFNNTY